MSDGPGWPFGSSEMAGRIRGFDWAATPLGPCQDWPLALKVAVQLMLAQVGPALLCVGPGWTQIYNDEHAALLGPRHPGELGRDARPRLADPELAAALTRVFAGETLSRHGQPCPFAAAEAPAAWFDLVATPVPDEAGRILAIMVRHTDATARVEAEAERARAAARESFLLRLSDTLRPLDDPSMIEGEACALLAGRLEVDRAYYVEVDEPAGTARVGRDFVRGGAASLAGEHRVADFAWSVEILRRGECHVVDDTQRSPIVPEADRPASAALGIIACMGAPLIKGDRLVGALCVTAAQPRAWAGEDVALLRDVGERIWAAIERARAEAALRESGERQAFLLRLSDALRPLRDPVEIQGVATRLLGEQLGASRVFYVFVEEDEDTAVILANYTDGVPDRLGRYSLSAFSSHAAGEWRAGRTASTDDVNADPRWNETERAAYASVSTRAGFGVPLIKERRLVALLGVNQSVPRRWTDAERELAREVAERTWAAVERARAEAALRESEAKFRSLFEAMDEGYLVAEVVLDEGGRAADIRFLEANAAALRLAGRNFVGLRLREVDPAYEDHWVEVYGHVARTGEAVRAEHYAAPHGRWFEFYAFRPGGAADRRIAVVFQDVTERRLAEAALRESEARFRGFAENSTDVLWIVDGTGERVLYLSPAFERVFGAPREAALGDMGMVRGLVHPDDRAAFDAAMPRSRAGEAVMVQYRIPDPATGRCRHLRDTGFPIRGEDGSIRYIAGIVQDLSDMVEAQQALEAEKERFRTLAEGIPQLVWRASAAGMWSWASPQWCGFTGQTPEASLGRGWLEALHPEDRETALAAWAELGPAGRLAVEYRVRRAADGAWRWHQTTALPLPGTPEWLGASTDIDDLKRLQAEQAVLLAELQHRTRNIVTVTRSIARRSFVPSPERDTYEGRLAAMGRVQGFLARSGAWSVPLRDLLEAELQAAGDGASERVAAAGPGVRLPGDKAQALALALHELATNAAKYGALAHPEAQLSVLWRVAADGRLVLDWEETGVPLPPGPPARRGYGSELLEQALPHQLGAETRREFGPDGLRCTIILPQGAFVATGEPA
jgi:PAS domain S-box-containing protein